MRLQHCSVSPDATCHSFYDRAFGVGLFFPLRAFGVLGLRARSSCLQCHPTCNAIRRPASLGAGGSGFRVWGFALSSVQCQPLILHAMPQQGAVVFFIFLCYGSKMPSGYSGPQWLAPQISSALGGVHREKPHYFKARAQTHVSTTRPMLDHGLSFCWRCDDLIWRHS